MSDLFINNKENIKMAKVLNKFTLEGKRFKQVTVVEGQLLIDKLPAGTYRFIKNETMQGVDYYFEPMEDFKIPDHITNQSDKISRVLTAYSAMDRSMGVMFSGIGGTGKTVMAKQISNVLREKENMPIIVIDHDSKEDMLSLMKLLEQPVVFFLDEFEKVFILQDREQDHFLTILDGVYTQKHLFLITINEMERVNRYLLNRPSRIRYHYKFDRVPKDIAKSLIRSRYIPLEDKYIDEMISICNKKIKALTYDVLFEFITEGNVFKDRSPTELLEDLNYGINPVTYGDVNIKALVPEVTNIPSRFQEQLDALNTQGRLLTIGVHNSSRQIVSDFNPNRMNDMVEDIGGVMSDNLFYIKWNDVEYYVDDAKIYSNEESKNLPVEQYPLHFNLFGNVNERFLESSNNEAKSDDKDFINYLLKEHLIKFVISIKDL